MKKVLNFLGVVLAIIGIFMIVIQPFSMTGAVIDVSTSASRSWFFLGVIFLAGGIVLFFSEGGWETRKTKIPLEEIIESGRDDNTIFVLDTSGIIRYKNNIHKLIESAYGRVYVPKRVLEELKKDHRNKRLVYEVLKSENIKQLKSRGSPVAERSYRIIKNIARNALEQTKKYKDYLNFKKIIETNQKPRGMDNNDFEEYTRRIDEEINYRLIEKKLKPTKQNQLRILKKHYKVSKGDLDVLTTALGNAMFGKRTKVIAEDTHIRDAIDKLKSKYPGLEYVNYAVYDNQYARV